MLEIRLLGQFDVQRAGRPVDIPSRPAQSLLAYLVLNPNIAHRREKLAGLLWPDAAEANARGYLRKALWQLRKSLGRSPQGEYLLADALSVTLDNSAAFWLDTADLERPTADGGPLEGLIQAVSVYRGDLLPGFYEEWAVLERERLRALFEHRTALLLDRLVGEGRWEEVLNWGEHGVSLGGAPEPAFRALMTAHAALGDRSGMAAVYERCRQALLNDLGVEPSEQTEQLFQRLSRGEGLPAPQSAPSRPASRPPEAPAAAAPASAPQARAGNLPVPLTSFIGRDQELAELKHLLGTFRLLTLTGAGGSGKTRLANKVAADLAGQHADGAWWVELAPLDDVALVAQTVAAVLGVRELPNEPIEETLTNYLRPRQALLVLDNCEHLIGACARLAERLLSACPEIRILATSREVLGLPGERLFQVPTLSVPELTPVPMAHLLGYDSIRLFLERAAGVMPDFALSEHSAPSLTQLCRRLDGIPLAIELAAARITVLTVEQIAARLDDRFRLLTGGSRTALPRQQTLRAAIDWSYALLSEAERRMLRRLAVFAGGWTLEAAEAVCVGEGVDRRDVLDLLAQLTNKSLLLADRRSGEETRYRLLETVREYAREKLAEADEQAGVRDRHLDYFVKLAEAAEPYLLRAEQVKWLLRLEAEHDNFRAAIGWATLQEDAASTLRLVAALMLFWFVRGYQVEGSVRLVQALYLPSASEQGVLTLRAKALNRAGFIAWGLVQSDETRYLLEEALALARTIGDQAAIATSLRNLGFVVYLESQPAQARAMMQEALAIWQALGIESTAEIAQTHSFIGDTLMIEGEPENAAPLYDQAIRVLRQLHERNVLAYSVRRLGYVALHRQNEAEAAALFRESLGLNREVGDQRAVANCLTAFAALAIRRGRPLHGARLFGAVDSLLESISAILLPLDRLEYERYAAMARAELGEPAFEAAWAEGQALTSEEAVEEAFVDMTGGS